MLFKKASHNVNTNVRFMLGAVAAAGVSLTCGAAHAQSSVTLYGIADVGVEHINNTSAGGAQTREVSGNLSGSRWGQIGRAHV